MTKTFEEFEQIGNLYYWVYAVYQGKPIISGWYRTEQEALTFGINKLPCRFEVIGLKTRSRPTAVSKIKHLLWDKTGNLDLGLSRAKHIK